MNLAIHKLPFGLNEVTLLVTQCGLTTMFSEFSGLQLLVRVFRSDAFNGNIDDQSALNPKCGPIRSLHQPKPRKATIIAIFPESDFSYFNWKASSLELPI